MMQDAVALMLFFALPATFFGVFRLARRSYERQAALWKLLVANLALSSALVSLVLPLGELYFRFVYDTTDSYQASRVSQRWVERHYRTNDIGMRDDVDYRVEAEVGARRVVIVGDSFTNGHGIEDVADRFSNRLRARHDDWTIELLAEDGLDTGAMLGRLERRLAHGTAADVVLYAYCPNDLSDLIRELDGPSQRLYAERPWWIVRHSYLLDVFWWRLRIGRDPELSRYFEYLDAAYRDERWAMQRQRLEQMQAIVEAHGARLVVMTWPFFERIDDPDYRVIHEKLSKFWAEQGVAHRDLIDTFDSSPYETWIVNRHDTHPNSRAHALATDVAEVLVGQALTEGAGLVPSGEVNGPRGRAMLEPG